WHSGLLGDICTTLLILFTTTATTEVHTLSLHDALPILILRTGNPGKTWALNRQRRVECPPAPTPSPIRRLDPGQMGQGLIAGWVDRKSTRLNSSDVETSPAPSRSTPLTPLHTACSPTPV